LPAQEEYDFFEECFFDASGKPVLANNTASCDIKISGIDKQVCFEWTLLWFRASAPSCAMLTAGKADTVSINGSQ
jgi:hypothetical protein